MGALPFDDPPWRSNAARLASEEEPTTGYARQCRCELCVIGGLEVLFCALVKGFGGRSRTIMAHAARAGRHTHGTVLTTTPSTTHRCACPPLLPTEVCCTERCERSVTNTRRRALGRWRGAFRLRPLPDIGEVLPVQHVVVVFDVWRAPASRISLPRLACSAWQRTAASGPNTVSTSIHDSSLSLMAPSVPSAPAARHECQRDVYGRREWCTTGYRRWA